MGSISKLQYAACRFCGQTQAIETEEALTAPQLEEMATRRCQCDTAIEYMEKATRKERAQARVKELFGEGAGESRVNDAAVDFINQAVELVCSGKIAKFTIECRGKVKAIIKLTSKEKVSVERSETDTQKYEE